MHDGIMAAVPIALVEDDPTSRFMLTRHLERAGYAVRAFESGEHFLDSIPEGLPAVVLLDVGLPGISGDELVRVLRDGSSGTRELPVIGVTAMAFPEEHRDFLRAGMNRVISKPVAIPELLDLVSEFVSV